MRVLCGGQSRYKCDGLRALKCSCGGYCVDMPPSPKAKTTVNQAKHLLNEIPGTTSGISVRGERMNEAFYFYAVHRSLA